MGTAIGMGLWIASLLAIAKGQRKAQAIASLSRLGVAILGGIVGGGLTGLVEWTGANLFGYK